MNRWMDGLTDGRTEQSTDLPVPTCLPCKLLAEFVNVYLNQKRFNKNEEMQRQRHITERLKSAVSRTLYRSGVLTQILVSNIQT